MRTATFRITRRGANHWHPVSEGSSELKRYGYGDSIVLPADAGTDPKWNNLGLVQTDGSVHTDVALTEKELGQEPANPAVKPAAGDIGAGDDSSETLTGDVGGTSKSNGNESEKTDDKAKIEALIDELEDSNGNAEFQKVRDKVIEADLFEEDTVPTKKAELLQALIDLRDGDGSGE